MNWLMTFLKSSLGQKLVMSLTGLFLISFLLIHLLGNLALLKPDGGVAFNLYTEFMSNNPLIQLVSKLLYFSILLHAIQGIIIYFSNRSAKGQRYAVKTSKNTSFASRNMALLGTLILAFIFLHMGDFWYNLKFNPESIPMVTIDGVQYKDAYHKVVTSFSNPLIVGAYLIGVLTLGLHLWHGFQSAFQTLGLNHSKYTPIIQSTGRIFSVLITIGFAMIPAIIFIKNM